jgi:hypothetical protein
MNCRQLINIHDHIYLSLHEHQQTAKIAQHESSNFIVIPLGHCVQEVQDSSQSLDPGFVPASLTEIYRFDEMVNSLQRQHPSAKLVFSTGTDVSTQVHNAFLVACHVIIRYNVGPSETYQAFLRIHSTFEALLSDSGRGNGLSVRICMDAIARVKQLGWIDFQEVFDVPVSGPVDLKKISIREYAHYARCVAERFYWRDSTF